tara:strand:+ start:4554 stop:5258 length:705 start_codon:yes stop_codon:yes gene_type:complete
MKRFYKIASIHEEDKGYSVCLDGKSVKTKTKKPLQHKSCDIAELMMLEWAEQDDAIKPDTMPVTQIITTLIDHVDAHREQITHNILKYLDTDLLCYRVHEPAALAERQKEVWGKWTDWCEKEYKASIQITEGLAALEQDKTLHQNLRTYVDGLDLDHFNILQVVTSLSGSLILALAFVHKQADPEDILECAYLEERYKEELYDADFYGSDPMLEKQQASKRLDLEACWKILSCL